MKFQLTSDLLRDTLVPLFLFTLLLFGVDDIKSYLLLRGMLLTLTAVAGYIIIRRQLTEAKLYDVRKTVKFLRKNYSQYFNLLSANISINFLRMISTNIDLLVAPLILAPIEFGAYAYARVMFSILS